MMSEMGSIEVINIRNNIPTDGKYFYIGRNNQGNVLGNPYTHKTGTLAQYKVSSREEAISKYESYFKESYNNNDEFKRTIDEIYNCYLEGNKVYLGCWCKPSSCHGDIIKKFIEIKYIKNKLQL